MKMEDIASFCAIWSCRPQMKGMGRIMIAASVMILGIEFPLKNWFRTPHLNVASLSGGVAGSERSQKALTGRHWKMVTRSY